MRRLHEPTQSMNWGNRGTVPQADDVDHRGHLWTIHQAISRNTGNSMAYHRCSKAAIQCNARRSKRDQAVCHGYTVARSRRGYCLRVLERPAKTSVPKSYYSDIAVDFSSVRNAISPSRSNPLELAEYNTRTKEVKVERESGLC